MNKSPEVLSAGIIVADHISAPISHLPAAGELVMADQLLLTIGGCAANAAVDLAKMGVAVAVVGRVGGDAFGRIVTELLSEHGLDVSTVQVSAGVATSQTLIVNVVGQDRRFIHAFGANALFGARDISLERVRQARVLYLGGYLLMPNMRHEELTPVFEAARLAGVKTVLDVAIPQKGEYLSRVAPLLPYVDVFLPNNHEAEMITGERDPVRQAELFKDMGAATVVVTCGGEGAVLVGNKVRLRAGVYPIEFVDGSGGGDAFDAGYICGLLDGLDEAGCLRLASALGASCVRAVGTTPGVFTRSECDQFMRKQELLIERI
jgi:sugar/nucleoside kinase (ribokinase family)